MTSMTARNISSVKRWRNSTGFTGVLASALLEWLLIFLLFVNALFSYLVTRLARFCELETPCLLCSRLDHLFGNETPGFYLDLICSAHKSEISSLVFCHVHTKLADVHGMCKGCLLSFATEKKSNSETYRLLVGKLGSDVECCADKDPSLGGASANKHCSCCNEPWTSRLDTNKMVQLNSTGPDVAESDIPLPDSVEKSRIHLHDDLECMEKISREVASSSKRKTTFDHLSHVGYSGLKITSDSESEVHISDDDDDDDDDRSSLVSDRHGHGEDVKVGSAPINLRIVAPEYLLKTPLDDLARVVLIPQDYMSEHSPLVPQAQPSVGDSHDLISSPLSEVNNTSPMADGGNDHKEEIKSQGASLDLHIEHQEYLLKTRSDAFSSEMLIRQISVPKPSLQMPQAQSNVGDFLDITSSAVSDGDGMSSLVHTRMNLKEDVKSQSAAFDLDAVHPEYLLKTLSDEVALKELISKVSVPESHLLVPQVQKDAENFPDIISPGLSDDDRTRSVVHGRNNLKDGIKSQGAPFDLDTVHPEYILKTPSDDLAAKELIRQVSLGEPSLLVPQAQQTISESPDSTHPGPEANIGHGLEDLNWHPVEEPIATSPSPEFISLKGVPSSSNTGDVFLEELTETLSVTGTAVLEPEPVVETQVITKVEHGSIASSGPDMRTNQVNNERGPTITNLMDLSDAYKLVISNKGSQSFNMPEQLSGKGSARVSGDLKLWLSQISSSRGLELSLSEISPRVHGQWEDIRYSDAPSPLGLQILQKRISLERNMSGFESLDGSIVSEIDGENMVDRLKRQVDYDRKSMNVLYKELEEERNASSVAANEALAMITRLQEEKATMQTEALQYLRMMEEQAEYDVDALQKANALLTEKEKEVQDLEAQLALYREKFPCESMVKKTQESTSASRGGNLRVDYAGVNLRGFNINTPCNTPREHFEASEIPGKTSMANGNNSLRITKETVVGFEDERSYISQRLKDLEKKLHLYSNNGVHFLNGGYSGNEESGVSDIKQLHYGEVTQESSQNEEVRLSMPNESSVCSPTQGIFSASTADHHFVISEEDSSSCEGRDPATHLVALENEVSHLNERLKALEADRNFLEHTINSLRTGEGIQFIEEIASDLQELRRIGIRREQALH